MNLTETDFDRERQWWNAKAPEEELDSRDENINRALRWREIERHLPGTKTILDIGGATGAFSIPLAKRGFRVTHIDLSPEMPALARQRAREVPNIEFLEGMASDPTQFSDRAFDLVLNMDGAISFSGSKAKMAIQETCRVARTKVILTVSHQAQMVAAWIEWSLAKTGRLGPAVHAMMDRGEWHQYRFAGSQVLTDGLPQNYLGALKAFLPDELTSNPRKRRYARLALRRPRVAGRIVRSGNPGARFERPWFAGIVSHYLRAVRHRNTPIRARNSTACRIDSGSPPSQASRILGL